MRSATNIGVTEECVFQLHRNRMGGTWFLVSILKPLHFNLPSALDWEKVTGVATAGMGT
jgi:hypothetical protein